MDQNPHKTVMMLREIAAGGKHFPDVVARDLAVIIGKLMEILSEGEKQKRFIPVNPFSVHLMVIGAFVLHRVSEPVRKKIDGFSDPAGIARAALFEDFAGDIERLVLRALKNDMR